MTAGRETDGPFGLIAAAAALTEALAGQRELYASLLALAHREETAIVASDVAELTRIVDEKEALIEHVNALETERVTALVAIASVTGINGEGATLSAISALLDDQAASVLMECGLGLRACAQAVREANERNALLLRGSRELVERWISYLRTALTGALYNAAGATAAGPTRRAFERSA